MRCADRITRRSGYLRLIVQGDQRRRRSSARGRRADNGSRGSHPESSAALLATPRSRLFSTSSRRHHFKEPTSRWLLSKNHRRYPAIVCTHQDDLRSRPRILQRVAATPTFAHERCWSRSPTVDIRSSARVDAASRSTKRDQHEADRRPKAAAQDNAGGTPAPQFQQVAREPTCLASSKGTYQGFPSGLSGVPSVPSPVRITTLAVTCGARSRAPSVPREGGPAPAGPDRPTNLRAEADGPRQVHCLVSQHVGCQRDQLRGKTSAPVSPRWWSVDQTFRIL